MSLKLQRYNPLLSPKVLRHGWIIVVVGVLFAAYRYLEAAREPERFVSVSRMIVSGRVILSETPTTYSEELANYLGTQIEIMRSQQIHSRSLQRLALQGVEVAHDGGLAIEIVRGTSIFELQSSSGNSEYARRYLDAVMEEFIEFKRDRRLAVSQSTLVQIAAEISRLEGELAQQDDALFAFRERNNIGFWEQQSTASASYLNDLKNRDAGLRLQLSLMENWRNIAASRNLSLAAQVVVPGSTGRAETNPLVTELLEVRRRLNELEIERDYRLRSLRPAHPIVQRLDRQVEVQTMLEQTAARGLLQTQEEQRLGLESEISSVQQAIAEWEGKALESSRIEAEFLKLTDSRDRTKDLYDRMVGSLRSIDVGKGVDQELVQVLQPASPASPRVKNLRSVVLQGLMWGCMFGFGLFWLVSRLDDRTFTMENAVEALGCPGVGEIPLLTASRISRRRRRYEQAAFDESFRRLRSLVLADNLAEKQMVLLVTSSLAAEGKTEIAVRLGHAFAAAGKRVLLIDADLRRGRMQSMFAGSDGGAKGFSEFLSEGLAPADVVQSTEVENLDFVPRGIESSSAGELFSTSKVARRLDALRPGYDVVILDSAPVGPVDDTTWLLTAVNKVLFVLRSGKTPLRVAEKNFDRIRERGAKDIGLVLNGAKPEVSSKYYHYYR